jgi:dTDP-glucose 4,6-dehydratase
MRVLMTGADGFIGSNVLQWMLNNTDWEFTCICSFRHMGNPLNIPMSERVTVITADLRGVIPDIGDFDYIIHLASESHVDRSQDDPVNFIENNVSSTLQVLEYARKHKPEKFIMFSTDEVYGARKHDDWDILLTTSPYSASKGAQELFGIAYYNTYQLPIIITNCNNVVGPNQHPEKFVPKIAKLIKEGKTVDLHVNKGKYGRRIYNPVNNVSSALKFILTRSYRNPHTQFPPRYSLTGGEELNNLQMAELVAEILGKKLKYRDIEATTVRPGYDDFYNESNEDKLDEDGWVRQTTLKEGLRWIKRL